MQTVNVFWKKNIILLKVYANISTQMQIRPKFIFQISFFNLYNAQSTLSTRLDAL